MISKILKRAAGLSVFLVVLSISALAQTGPIEGTVKVKAEDGSLNPVPGALVDIYRTDIKAHWEVKTDKAGHYIRLGMPLAGTFIVVVSGPGLQPTWVNGVRITQSPVVDVVANPGDGTRMTLEQVMAAINQSKSGAPAAAAPPAASAADRAKAEASAKEYEAKKKEREQLQGKLDEAIKHYNQAGELKKADNLQGALSEYKLAADIDPTKDKAFIEVAHKANASLAETHYLVGADIFNKNRKAVPEAKPHFEEGVKAIKKAITIASTDPSPNINNDLIVYYNILAKNVKLLVQYYQMTDGLEEVMQMLDKAEALDSTNRVKWLITKGELYRLSYQNDQAVAAFKKVLEVDPNNADAFYGLGLTLVSSGDKAKLQEAANYLADFVAKAPASDPRVAEVKDSLQALKNEFKVEAEKPATRRRGRP
ncbi:MAG TPA: tetratricopeptide repeat protein [Blastocatellia bacterium]|nr:tetratricopeptide repeat protein [Blastocatellia bacterium]